MDRNASFIQEEPRGRTRSETKKRCENNFQKLLCNQVEALAIIQEGSQVSAKLSTTSQELPRAARIGQQEGLCCIKAGTNPHLTILEHAPQNQTNKEHNHTLSAAIIMLDQRDPSKHMDSNKAAGAEEGKAKTACIQAGNSSCNQWPTHGAQLQPNNQLEND